MQSVELSDVAPDHELATIRGTAYDYILHSENCYVLSVDGEEVNAKVVKVQPGRRNLELRCKTDTYVLLGESPVRKQTGQACTVNFEPGHSYKIDFENPFIFLEDRTTGRRVSGCSHLSRSPPIEDNGYDGPLG